MHDDIKKALDVLHKGGLILYPTDTIWAIGCDATNPEAVAKVFELKKRSLDKPLMVLLDNTAKLQGYLDEIPEVAYDMAELTESPLTIIYDGAKNLVKGIVAADGSVGIRITAETFSQQLCARFKKPIVLTSANVSGHSFPKTFSDVTDEIKQGVDFVVTFRQDETSQGKPSSIVKLGRGGEVKIIRD